MEIIDQLSETDVDDVPEGTSTTDNAGRISLTVGLTLLIVLRLTSIGGMDPPDMTVNFFGIIPPPLGVATVVPVNFAQNSLRIKLDSWTAHNSH